MISIGISGAWSSNENPFMSDLRADSLHDAAAALAVDGELVAVVEEERLTREKHTNRFPLYAMREVLDAHHLALSDIDHFGYFFEETFTDREIANECTARGRPIVSARQALLDQLACLGAIDGLSRKIAFHKHHLAHARHVLQQRNDDQRLVLVVDGNGEQESATVYSWQSNHLAELHAYGVESSVGHFYKRVTQHLGFGVFDEYKVMGLAPFGDPGRFGDLFAGIFALGPQGQYRLDWKRVSQFLTRAGIHQRSGDHPLEQVHRDVAAWAQSVAERILFHVVTHWASVTGFDKLSITGGVAQNTTFNGRLLATGLLSDLWVDFAPHDGGSAAGAALLGFGPPVTHPTRSPSAFLGSPRGHKDHHEQELQAWAPLVSISNPADPCVAVTKLISSGAVVGWFSGRSEFGPRALGHRSILADAREPANQDKVNRIVKERESFRPFAPVALTDGAETFFDISSPTMAPHDYMSFVVPVRSDARDLLPATTHHDGTARLQTVSSTDAHPLRDLLLSFGQFTGTPVLLNTSFNNSFEPIVETVDDAMAMLFTSALDALVIEGSIVQRLRPVDWGQLSIALLPYCELVDGAEPCVRRQPRENGPTTSVHVTQTCLEYLSAISGDPRGETIPPPHDVGDDLGELWRKRLVRVTPMQRRANPKALGRAS